MTTDLHARLLHIVTEAADRAGADQRDPLVILEWLERLEAIAVDERVVAVIEAWHSVNDTWARPEDVVGAVEAVAAKVAMGAADRKATSTVRPLITY